MAEVRAQSNQRGGPSAAICKPFVSLLVAVVLLGCDEAVLCAAEESAFTITFKDGALSRSGSKCRRTRGFSFNW